jgi:hypothetical protein
VATSISNCWAFRVDRRYVTDLDAELQAGWLRQGWGWDVKQDLRAMEIDAGAARNLQMFNRVKKGDYVLIPHLPQYGYITIAEATQDWNTGYQFSIWAKSNDHGHIFPAKALRNFRRGNHKIPASVIGTFRNPSRFWNVTYLKEVINRVLELPAEDLEPTSSVVDRWRQQIVDISGQSGLQKELFGAAEKYFSKSDWEYLLTEALQRLNPGWKIRRTGGKAEAKHGTDILATTPDLFGDGELGIAIQVKDYEGIVSGHPIKQVQKAETSGYWKDRGIQIIELVVVVIRGDKKTGHELQEAADEQNVRLIWSTDVEDLIFRSACRFMSDPDRQTATIDSVVESENGQDPET